MQEHSRYYLPGKIQKTKLTAALLAEHLAFSFPAYAYTVNQNQDFLTYILQNARTMEDGHQDICKKYRKADRRTFIFEFLVELNKLPAFKIGCESS